MRCSPKQAHDLAHETHPYRFAMARAAASHIVPRAQHSAEDVARFPGLFDTLDAAFEIMRAETSTAPEHPSERIAPRLWI